MINKNLPKNYFKDQFISTSRDLKKTTANSQVQGLVLFQAHSTECLGLPFLSFLIK